MIRLALLLDRFFLIVLVKFVRVVWSVGRLKKVVSPEFAVRCSLRDSDIASSLLKSTEERLTLRILKLVLIGYALSYHMCS